MAMRRRAWIAGGIAFGIAAVLLAFEAMQAAHDLRAAREGLVPMRRLAAALEVTERKQDEFEREVELLSKKQELLDLIMPSRLGTEDFLARYRAIAQEHGVTVDDARFQEDKSDTVHRADLKLTLSGPPGAIAALRERTRRLSRLTRWSQVAPGPPTRVTVSVYAYPPTPPMASPPCRPPEDRVWLWPFSGQMAAVRADWAGLCATYDRLRPIQVRVDAFETARTRFGAMITEIEQQKAADLE
jgi:hypothetical protein